VKLEKNAKRVTGGWAKALPDIEWFVKRESEVAKAKGKKVFLSGFSMVCPPLTADLGCADEKGGGEVLAFATRPTAPPSKESIGLLSGVIAGGPLIRQTTPASAIEVSLFYLSTSLKES
jgi:acylglycerol lipase